MIAFSEKAIIIINYDRFFRKSDHKFYKNYDRFFGKSDHIKIMIAFSEKAIIFQLVFSQKSSNFLQNSEEKNDFSDPKILCLTA